MNAALEAAASATLLQSTSDGDLSYGKRCSVQKCPLDGKGVIKYRCSYEDCNKTVHMACYTVTVLGPNGKLDPLPDNSNGPGGAHISNGPGGEHNSNGPGGAHISNGPGGEHISNVPGGAHISNGPGGYG
jgi:hypothetical protein